MPKEKEDLRNLAAEAMLEILGSKLFPDISITELVKKAGISSNYFHTRIKTKEAVVEHYIDTICKAYTPLRITSYKDRLERIMTHFLRYKDPLLLLHKNGLTHFFRPQIEKHYLSLATMERLTPEMEYKVLMHADAFYRLLHTWLDYGMRQKPLELLESTKIAEAEGNAISTDNCQVWHNLSAPC